MRRFRNVWLTAWIHLIAAATVSIGGAQPPSELDQAAMQRFQEGVQAWQAGKLETARIAFQQAYGLRPTPNIAFDLGQLELALGKHVEAAQHLSEYLQQTEDKPSKTRQEARKGLVDAEARIGRFVVYVDIDGADIDIDGQVVGKSPTNSLNFYVTPGAHAVRARKDEYRDSQASETVAAGESRRIDLHLEPVKRQERTSPPLPTPWPSAQPASADADRTPSPALSTSPPTALLAAGGALTLAAATLAVVEGLRASSATSDIQALERDGLSGRGVCYGNSSPGCASLSEAVERHDDATRLMRGAFVATGVLGVATFATWLFWPREPQRSDSPGVSRLQIALPPSGQAGATIVLSGVLP